MITMGIVNGMARNAPDSPALRGILIANLVSRIITFVLDFRAATTGVVNAQGWGPVVQHLVIGAGFAYYLLAKPKPTALADGARASA